MLGTPYLEFAILMPKLPLEKAFLSMEALRTHLASDAFFQTLGDMAPIGTFGVRVGLASSPRDAKETSALMRMAD